MVSTKLPLLELPVTPSQTLPDVEIRNAVAAG
jgi:hypothetical protein